MSLIRSLSEPGRGSNVGQSFGWSLLLNRELGVVFYICMYVDNLLLNRESGAEGAPRSIDLSNLTIYKMILPIAIEMSQPPTQSQEYPAVLSLQSPPFWQRWLLQSSVLISHLIPSQPGLQLQNTSPLRDRPLVRLRLLLVSALHSIRYLQNYHRSEPWASYLVSF